MLLNKLINRAFCLVLAPLKNLKKIRYGGFVNANVKSFNELLIKVQEWYYKTLNSDKQGFQTKIIEVKRIPFLPLQKLKSNWHKVVVSSGLIKTFQHSSDHRSE